MGEGRRRHDLVVAAIGAALGFGAVFAIPERARENEHDAAGFSPSQNRARSESHRLSAAEPKSLALAALGGRTKPARERFAELWARETESEEAINLALALIFADPGWFAEFSRTHDESEVQRLLQATLPRLAKTHPEAFWRLLGESESVRQFWSSAEPAADRSWVYGAIRGAPGTAFEFVMTHWDVLDGRVKERALSRGARQPERARRALQRWRAMGGTSDSDDLPGYIKAALWNLHKHDDSALSVALEGMDAETRAVWEGELRVIQHTREDGQVPELKAEDLVGLNESQSKEMLERQALAGRVPSIESLIVLDRAQRGSAALAALGDCYRNLPRSEVERFVEQIDRLDLGENDRLNLQASAAYMDWNAFSDIEGALLRLDALPDRPEVRNARERVFREWIYVDPLAVTRYAEDLPAGEIRDDLLTRAREATP